MERRHFLAAILSFSLLANAFSAPTVVKRLVRATDDIENSNAIEDNSITTSSALPVSSIVTVTLDPFDDDDDDDFEFGGSETTSSGGSNVFSVLKLISALFPGSGSAADLIRKYIAGRHRTVSFRRELDLDNEIEIDDTSDKRTHFQKQETNEDSDSGSSESRTEESAEDVDIRDASQQNSDSNLDSDEDSDYDEPPGGGDGAGGGILGLLAGLSGGDSCRFRELGWYHCIPSHFIIKLGDELLGIEIRILAKKVLYSTIVLSAGMEDGQSDLGSLLATFSGIIANLSGDGIDLNSLIASGIGLFAGLLSEGEENPGAVIASYFLTSLDTLTGGGANNNGAFFGNFLSKLIKGTSAGGDPDASSEEDGKNQPMADSAGFVSSFLLSLLGDMSKSSSGGSSKPW